MDHSHYKANHLLKDELDYELRVRGVATKRDVASKRNILQRLLSKEDTPKVAPTLVDIIYQFNNDKQILTTTLDSIRTSISEFEGTNSDSAYKRLTCRLIYLYYRVQRLKALDGDDAAEVRDFKNETHATVLELEADLNFRLRTDPDEVTRQSIASVTSGPVLTPPVVTQNVAPVISSRHVPVFKWGLSFDGESRGIGLNSFLERVEELSTSRNVSKYELFSTAVDLFSGKALLWYRAVKNTITDWDSLVRALRKDFLPPDYDDGLWEEIKSRYQGRGESIVLYLAVMEALFSRLSKVPLESTRVRLIRKNLLPHFISHLALVEVSTIDELSTACRKIEDSMLLKQRSRLPNRAPNKFLEPELAFTDPTQHAASVCVCGTSATPKRPAPTPKNSSNRPFPRARNNAQPRPTGTFPNSQVEEAGSPMSCWNCHLPNHTFSSCTLRRKKFCYRCGAPEVTVKDCPRCSPQVNSSENQ